MSAPHPDPESDPTAPAPAASPLPILSTFADDTQATGVSLPSTDAFLEAYGPMTRRQTHWFAIKVIGRAIGISLLVLLGYFLLPVSADGQGVGLVILFGSLTVLVLVIVNELRRIVISEHPAIRAVEAVAIVIPLFIVVFAYAYVWMSNDNPANFTQPIDRVDGIYFTVTMLSTVGFGDITAVSQNARIVVTVQMILDLILIGVVAKLIVGASRIGVQRRRSAATAPGPATPGGASDPSDADPSAGPATGPEPSPPG
jgi:hypothetical protein